MLCLLRRYVIASKFDYFVIHETHVQSACRRHRQYVTTAINVEMFCKLNVAEHVLKCAFEYSFCLVVVLKMEKAQRGTCVKPVFWPPSEAKI